MKKIRIVIDNKIPFLKGVLEPFAEVEYLSPENIVRATVKNADALLVRTRTKCDSNLLDGSSVKFIGTATIGFDHINTNYCDSHNIKWVNAPGCNSTSVMQYMASTLVTLAENKNLNLSDMSIGIIGVGNVGSKIARLAKAFGMKAFLNDPPRARLEGDENFVELDELISQSDIITFHVPLNKDGRDNTFHLADEFFFEKLGCKKIIINTSRGEVIKTSELKRSIKDENIKACALDVWENEPDIDRELLSLVDIGTPHIAGYSADGKANGTSVCLRALASFFDFKVDPKWYPSDIPQPARSTKIEIDCNVKSDQKILAEAIIHTYNIREDDKILRKSIETFESQRGNYPVRREFAFYNIELKNSRKEIRDSLIELGFNVLQK